MNFKKAFQLMKEGKKIKLPSWAGYWAWENDTIMMHCKDGQVIDIRETKTPNYTFSNIASDDWVLAEEDNTPILGGQATFSFGEALKYLKRGFAITRKGWNGKGMHVTKLTLYTADNVPIDNPCLVLYNVQGKYNTWVPSITDIMAEDWGFVE